MRPVNLIPAEDRRGESAPSRTGGLAYVVVGALAIVLAAVIGVVMLDKQVADRESEAVALEAEQAQLQARAQSLSSFVTLQGIRDARVATIDSLARSRFDWERVLRELSLVIPDGVWLTNLSGSVSPSVNVESGGGGGSELRASVPGPALELTGCGRSHSDVARLVAAMEDIDGVTRVTATTSAKGDSASGAGTGECQTRPSIPAFDLIAAFDEVPVAISTAPAPVPPTVEQSVPADGGVASVESQRASSQAAVESAEADAEGAANLVPGG